ncbi:hypothetical protein M404DRAFT_792597 [Pisolithus tinctorius Marx 270]|uniref:Uncharacterized protein n=1 Tax=Pisolithus tinctorius Marx 270 TaxID=870435 RepID=A0A0C3PSK0_PISTI|nr:hypothetical protein M404DRAFT_792597 [Pisolithus tinctorius Marx 270]
MARWGCPAMEAVRRRTWRSLNRVYRKKQTRKGIAGFHHSVRTFSGTRMSGTAWRWRWRWTSAGLPSVRFSIFCRPLLHTSSLDPSKAIPLITYHIRCSILLPRR